MSVLVVGLSHRSAPVELLERAAVGADESPSCSTRCCSGSHVTEAMVLSTCNRIEVYAVVDAFHGGLADVSGVLGRHAGLPLTDLTKHLYVHYADSAVAAPVRRRRRAGLDGDRRGADPRPAARAPTPPPTPPTPSGARCTSCRSRRCGSASGCTPTPASTPRAPRSSRWRSPPRPRRSAGGLAGVRAVVVGAGAMGALAAAHLRRARRRRDRRAQPLAPSGRSGWPTTSGAPAPRPAPPRSRPCRTSWPRRTCWSPAPARSARSSPARRVAAALAARDGRPLVVCDLGLPRDVDPASPRCPASPSSTWSRCRRRLAPRAPARPTPRPRSWSPRRRRPTWPRSGRPRSPRP